MPFLFVASLLTMSFTGRLVQGDGLAAQALKEAGLLVFGENDTELLKEVFQK